MTFGDVTYSTVDRAAAVVQRRVRVELGPPIGALVDIGFVSWRVVAYEEDPEAVWSLLDVTYEDHPEWAATPKTQFMVLERVE